MGLARLIRCEWLEAAGVVVAALVGAELSWTLAALLFAAEVISSSVAAVPGGLAVGILVAVLSRGAKPYWHAFVAAFAVGLFTVAGGLLFVILPD
ncbi:MAG: hypothetical protein QM765_51835 [Myxococcales bacterium]